jgi:hypothetical protein
VALPGNQAVNGENKHQPVYREKPGHSTKMMIYQKDQSTNDIQIITVMIIATKGMVIMVLC